MERDDDKDALQELAASSFYSSRGLLSHHFESFNRFCENVASVMSSESEQDVTMYENTQEGVAKLRVNNVLLLPPMVEDGDRPPRPLLPAEARLRNMSYSASMYADVELKVYSKSNDPGEQALVTTLVQQYTFEKVRLGELPVMVNSKLCHLRGANNLRALKSCPFDMGAYFIVKGVEKVLIPQEEPCMHITRVWKKKAWTASFATPSERYSNRLDVTYEAGQDGQVGHFYVQIPGIQRVPVVIVLRALGVSTDKQVLELVTQDIQNHELTELFKPSLVDAQVKVVEFISSRKCGTEPSRRAGLALEFIASNVKKGDGHSGEQLLEQRLLPGLGGGSIRKALFLGYMVRCLSQCILNHRPLEDMDSFKNKRLVLAGELFDAQLKQLKFRFLKDILKRAQKLYDSGREAFTESMIIDKSMITNGFNNAFSTGNWASKGKSCGIVATLKRDNPMLTLSQMRLLTKGMAFAKNAGVAKLPNASHYGRVCLVETPDDEKCGLTKTLAVFAMVSSSTSEEDILDKLSDCQMQSLEDVPHANLHRLGKIFLNGKWVGVTDDLDVVLHTMRKLRRRGLISPEAELVRVFSQNELRIFTDGGRLLRPLLVVEGKQPLLFKLEHKVAMTMNLTNRSADKNFGYLLEQGVIDLLGPEEEENASIALSEKELSSTDFQFTHMEMHPASLMGVGAIGIPFLNHNQSSRVSHQAQKHGKQAIGHYTCNLRTRMDTSAHQLFYPQCPLLKPHTRRFYGDKVELANGANCIVAVASLGYNQEDSLILNQSSLDRGLFRSYHYRVYKDTLPPKSEQSYGKPDVESARKSSSGIEKLEGDGLPRIEESLTPRDVVIGKILPKANQYTDCSIKLKSIESTGKVDQVVCSTGAEGQRVVKVRLRETRSPEIGDKFSSMHGQKGVVGMIYNQEDLFFTQQGIVPDVIINPHAFPTRQTLAQQLESFLGKAAACDGALRRKATPFTHPRLEEISEKLHRCNFQRWGQERVYSGRSGKQMEGLTTIGITFYQRLTHMAVDKVKWRGRTGPVHPLTLQPVKDRNRHGGVKFGEMERDCLVAHGASAAVQERLFLLSDKSKIDVCSGCDRLVSCTRGKRSFCNFCDTDGNILTVEVPHACKLLHMELSTMCVDMRFKLKIEQPPLK